MRLLLLEQQPVSVSNRHARPLVHPHREPAERVVGERTAVPPQKALDFGARGHARLRIPHVVGLGIHMGAAGLVLIGWAVVR